MPILVHPHLFDLEATVPSAQRFQHNPYSYAVFQHDDEPELRFVPHIRRRCHHATGSDGASSEEGMTETAPNSPHPALDTGSWLLSSAEDDPSSFDIPPHHPHGNRTPPQQASHHHRVHAPTVSPQLVAKQAIPATGYNYHVSLIGCCRFVPLGEHTILPFDPALGTVTTSPYSAFIGQTRFETTAEQIAWLVREACGVELAFVAAHQIGCFVAHCWSAADLDAVLALSGRILFDASGAWVADTAEQTAGLKAYISSIPLQILANRTRLPRNAMVVEPYHNSRRRVRGKTRNEKRMKRGAELFSGLE